MPSGPAGDRHLIVTVNAAWNLKNFRLPLLRALIADGYRVTVLAPPDDSVPDLVGIGCRFLPLHMDVKGLSPRRDLALVARFRRRFLRERPDAVLSFTIKNNVFGAMAARLCGVPFVPNVTGLGTAFLSGRAMQKISEALYRLAFAPAPTVFFQNIDDRTFFVGRGLVSETQAALLPGSGIDLAHFAPAPLPSSSPGADTTAPVFLMIARMLRDKGVHEFVEAARLLRQSHPEARCLLLGPLGAENRSAVPAEQVARWQSEGVVEYLGSVKDVRPYIADADCVVLPSYREGTARTLLEAAAMARPLIATDVPGCRNVLDAGKTGFLVNPRDAQDLAVGMRRFACLPPADRTRMGFLGRRKMEEEFDQAIVIEAYRRALSDIL